MTEIGYFLSSEEHGPSALVDQARQAEEAGFASVWISDHYHPWTDRQGLPEAPVPVYVSGLGPKSVSLAARIGDGYCSTAPDAEMIQRYRSEGGRGPTQAGMIAPRL